MSWFEYGVVTLISGVAILSFELQGMLWSMSQHCNYVAATLLDLLFLFLQLTS